MAVEPLDPPLTLMNSISWNFHFGLPEAPSINPFVSPRTFLFSDSCPDSPSGAQLPFRGPESTLPRLLAVFFKIPLRAGARWRSISRLSQPVSLPGWHRQRRMPPTIAPKSRRPEERLHSEAAGRILTVGRKTRTEIPDYSLQEAASCNVAHFYKSHFWRQPPRAMPARSAPCPSSKSPA